MALKKVLIISYYWPPSGGAGVQRWVKFSKYLEKQGWEPFVITVNPDKASYALQDSSLEEDVKNIRVFKTSTFEPFQLYKKLLGKKEIPYAGFANEGKAGIPEKISRFVRGNFFIPDARVGWNRYVLPVAARLIREYHIRHVVTTSPPHSTQLIGVKLKSKFDINWIADLRDPWTDIYYYPMLYHTRLAAAYDKKLEGKVLQTADKVVVVSESIKNLFSDKFAGMSRNKIYVIPNGYDENDFKDLQFKKNELFTITYTGTMTEDYHLDRFLEMLPLLRSGEWRLRFVGHVSENYRHLIGSLGLSGKIEFVSYVRHQEAVSYMVSSDVLLLAVPDVADNEGILTGKLFEYLASGTPVLGIGPVEGDAAQIIRECQAGKMFDYQDADGMKNFLDDKMKKREAGQLLKNQNSCTQYSREALTARMAQLFS